ncbi:MAG: amidohydrolase family protein [Gammaproteobacteria bacterium]|nr:amidohydrolase family protein [Gammaproteobacteria bacterium]
MHTKKKYLLDPNIALIREWQTLANGAIKLLTFAPELNNSDQFINCLQTLNIIPAIGHSNATFQEAEVAIKRGCKHITHLFNAMSGLHHRYPGVALSAFQHDILCELIADGHHVSWDMLNFVVQKKGCHELCLVTDSMRAKCMPDGEYRLGEQKVYLKNSQAKLEDGTLAGSVLRMQDAVKNLIQQNICTLKESIFLSSINPAKQLGLFNKIGSIAIWKMG